MAENHAVFQSLRNMIVEMKDLTEDEVTQDTSIDELGFDSLDYVELKVHVQREFLVALIPALFETRIKTIGQLCAYIAEETASLEA